MTIASTAEAGMQPSRPSIPSWLRELTAVAVAIVGRDGRLRDGNRGFAAFLAAAAGPDADVRELFVNPRFSQFAVRTTRRADRVVYRGILNLGRGDRRVASLKGTVYGYDDALLVVAEHDIAETERLNAALWRLNLDLEASQRDLARLAREAESDKAMAEAALRDRDALLTALSARDD